MAQCKIIVANNKQIRNSVGVTPIVPALCMSQSTRNDAVSHFLSAMVTGIEK